MQKPQQEARVQTHTLDVPPIDDSETRTILIDSVLPQNRFKDNLSKRLGTLMFLAALFDATQIQVKVTIAAHSSQLVLEGFNLKALALPPEMNFREVTSFFNRLAASANTTFLIELGILTRADLLSCITVPAKMPRLELIDSSRLAFELLKRRQMNFTQLCALLPAQLENLKEDICFSLIEKNIIKIDRVINFCPAERAIYNHPIVACLMIEHKLLASDWVHININDLPKLKAHDKPGIDAFIERVVERRLAHGIRP